MKITEQLTKQITKGLKWIFSEPFANNHHGNVNEIGWHIQKLADYIENVLYDGTYNWTTFAQRTTACVNFANDFYWPTKLTTCHPLKWAQRVDRQTSWLIRHVHVVGVPDNLRWEPGDFSCWDPDPHEPPVSWLLHWGTATPAPETGTPHHCSPNNTHNKTHGNSITGHSNVYDSTVIMTLPGQEFTRFN